jgi:hypothetical protein
MSAAEEYAVYRDGHTDAAETWPKTLNGIVTATNRAAFLSLKGGPHEIRLPDGKMIARYVGGRRADLPPGGIIAMADARIAEGQVEERPRTSYPDRTGYEAHFTRGQT